MVSERGPTFRRRNLFFIEIFFLSVSDPGKKKIIDVAIGMRFAGYLLPTASDTIHP